MKATDLMCGDWVLINGTPHRIQAIDSVDEEISADDELYFVGEDRCHSEDKIEGIPITREILEKNGWECNGNYMIIKVGNNTLYWVEYLDCGLYKNEYNMCTCKYVHQLQHALRLCGFDVLADTFKI